MPMRPRFLFLILSAVLLLVLTSRAALPAPHAVETKETVKTVETGERPETARKAEEPLSLFEAYVRGKSPEAESFNIRQFGYELFEGQTGAFTSSEALPVGPGYLLGPGDELIITFWKKFNAEHVLVVDREGKINIPEVGIIQVAGLTFSEAKELLAKELHRYYKPSEVKMNVSMGRLRSMRVFVVGKVKRPGSYTVSAMSTLVNALLATGGPDKTGSLRDIQVKRNGETLVHFDLYDLLLKGDTSSDIRLMPEDVVFIPSVGPLVAVTGSVITPAIYELKEGTGLKDLIEMAGGVSAGGYLHRIQIERVEEGREKVVLDVDYTGLDEGGGVPVRDGDIVKVFPISQAVKNPVVLKGNVVRPGVYEWKEGLRIGDLIRDTGDLKPDTLLDFAVIERLVPPDNHWEYLTVDLGKLLISKDEEENILLEPHDNIVVYNRWDVEEKKYVRVAGAVNQPESYEYRENMTLSDLIKLAGGMKRYAYTESAELSRVIPTDEGPETTKIIVNPARALTGDPAHDIPLKEDDYLFIRTVPGWKLYETVTLTGEVNFPGTYIIKKGERLSSLIERAGGFTESAYLKGAVFTRESIRALQQRQLDEAINRLEMQLLVGGEEKIEGSVTPEEATQRVSAVEQKKNFIEKMRQARAKGRISIKLAPPAELRGTPYDIPLEDGDTLNIPDTPVEVQVLGEVFNQNAYLYDPRGTVSYYIKNAGGLTRDADKGEIYVLKVDGTAVSKRSRGMRSAIRWSSDDNRWIGGSFGNMRLDPGDTIFVPVRLEKVAWLREVKDLTQILYQVAVTAGVLIVAF